MAKKLDAVNQIVAEKSDLIHITIVDMIKSTIVDQKKAQDNKDQAEKALHQAKLDLDLVDKHISNLCKQLLEEQLGSVYAARVVLYHLTGKWL